MTRLLLTAALFATPVMAQMAVPPAPPPAPVKVAVTTSMGRFVIAVEKAKAPITAGNFLRYVDQKRLDGAACYRASKVPGTTDKGFLQCGTQNDPKRTLPKIAHEPTTLTGLSHVDGAVSMARLAPGTAQGDWIIALGPLKYLDANPAAPGDNVGNAVFGRVIEGMDIVLKIHAAPVGQNAANPVMKGEMLSPPVKILTARRIP